MSLYKDVTLDDDPVLKHEYHELKVSVRLPSAEQLVKGREILKRGGGYSGDSFFGPGWSLMLVIK